jgi:hypothetical protein
MNERVQRCQATLHPLGMMTGAGALRIVEINTTFVVTEGGQRWV